MIEPGASALLELPADDGTTIPHEELEEGLAALRAELDASEPMQVCKFTRG